MSTFTIIGGGIAGASIAYHLAKSGHPVTVYDRLDKGQATSASAGIICPWVSQRRNKKWYRLVREGARYYPDFIKQLEAITQLSTGYRKNGAICLFKDNHIQQLAYDRIAAKQVDAPEMGKVIKMTKQQVKAMHPYLTDSYPAVFVEGGGQVNGEKLLSALKVGVLHYGGQWLKQAKEPTELDHTVIYTAGAWSREHYQQPNIKHQRAELLHFRLLAADQQEETPVVMGLGPMYIVETEKNNFAIGTTHEDTDSFNSAPSSEGQRYLYDQAVRYFPDRRIENQTMAVGLRPFTRDSLPYIGYVKDNNFVVNGLGSSGLTAAPVIGREVANYLTGKETALDLNDYAYF
ncbi:NAD(P)/FAD-dependent oxidoreductase [Amphibacillus jilinensis]|uniref:NAD(P)/FAD-dependent oxidoreductase n=1 Tax=Amphibacillus jilinensis TaxID=1216008 RepID=UPI00031ED0BE|nr:FAD-dependent oxidoreductase [Amphibacillus jilinensis]